MEGPSILARTLSKPGRTDKFGNTWQYNSRSDHHSQVLCWGILFDLLAHSEVLRAHFATGKVVFGVNHEMVDFKANRKKKLDLVVCTPLEPGNLIPHRDLASLAADKDIVLTASQKTTMHRLAGVVQGEVGSVRVALEAKACMTAHVRAKPRLYDELNSSQLTIHGAEEHAIAGGVAMVNLSPTFVSTDLNKFPRGSQPPAVSRHRQPEDARQVIEKIGEIPRRSKAGEGGFDALGVIVVDCKNDGSPVSVVDVPPAPPRGDIFHYDSLIRRIASAYEARYR